MKDDEINNKPNRVTPTVLSYYPSGLRACPTFYLIFSSASHHDSFSISPPQSTQVSFIAQPLMGSSFILVPFAMMGAGVGFALPAIQVGPAAVAAAPPAPAPAKAPDGPEGPANTTTATVRVPAGAGLPAPLLAMLRSDDGPFLANEVFMVTPTEPLAPIEEAVPVPEWYAVTRGRFVGVVDQFALSTVAISGVAHGARKAYTTQALALDAFNQALTWGGVQVA
ncbi:hypothetical protein B0H13DRAFT_2343383 [Mycena leptocephala]|nr:hypothetical protein B0H13DRAFT_2343383 [Mycena leptocephala]